MPSLPTRHVGTLAAIALLAALPSAGPTAAAEPCAGGGCQAWVATYDGPAQGLDTPRNLGFAADTLALSPDGGTAFVTGTSFGGFADQGGSHYDYLTIAYDTATGERRWEARYAGPGNSQDSAWAIEVSAGRVFVTGASVGRTDPLDWDFATVAYEAATGAELWVHRYDAGPVDRAWSLGASQDGSRVYVTGDSRLPGGSASAFHTIAYDAETGEEAWSASYEGPGGSWDDPRWLAVAPDGSGVFVTGRSTGLGTSYDYATVAYDAETGQERWTARYNGAANGWDEATAVTVAPDSSGVFVTGQSFGQGTSYDYATVAYDAATGQERWAARYNGPGNSIDIALGTATTNDGSLVLVTGQANGAGSSAYDYGTVAYKASSGAQRWVAHYNGPPGNSTDMAYAVAPSADDEMIYVTGESAGASHYDIATVAYDTETGYQHAVGRYNGPEDFQDAAFALSVDPDGSRMYVAGESWHSQTAGVGDYATLAYDAATLTGLGVTELSASSEGEAISVRGSARFGGEAPVAVGQDPAGDNLGGATASPHGVDLRSLAISQPDAADPALSFAIGLQGLTAGGVPEGMLYRWDVRIAGIPGGWSIRTMRTSAAATGGAEPYAALYECPATGACTRRATLSATYDAAAAHISVRLPLPAIGAGPGTTIEAWPRDGEPVQVVPTGAGVADLPAVIDSATHLSYRVPDRSVSLGIARPGTPQGQIAYEHPAPLTGDGFAGSISAGGLHGPFEVWARACFGTRCAGRSIPIELP